MFKKAQIELNLRLSLLNCYTQHGMSCQQYFYLLLVQFYILILGVLHIFEP